MAYQLEAIHDALRSEIDSEKSSEMRSGSDDAMLPSIDQAILRDLSAEPSLSARRLAERLNLSPRAVEKHLAALQRKGRLQRQGSPRGGHWWVF